MFESLKKKLKTWLGTEEPEKKDKKSKKASKQETQKKEKKTKEKKAPKEKKVKAKKVSLEEDLKEKAEATTEEVPLEFNPGLQKYEPNIEAIQEEAEEPEKKEGFFSRFTKKIGSSKITKDNVEEIFTELEIILLENNVALEVVDKIKENLIEKLVGTDAKKSDLEKTILKALNDSIESVLQEPEDLIKLIKAKKDPFVIVFFGINGAGKTTSLAKVAHYLKKNGLSCVLAAGDTFRAASIEQLEKHGEKLGVKVIKHEYGSDPTSVAFDAKKYAEKSNIDVVLIDTAGRMYTKENLIKEMEKIIRVIKPDLKLFVGESITGNDATEQARTFSEAIGIDGIILTKADVDDKGGTALSVSYITKKPIFFLGQGQTYDDLKPFKKSDILKHLGLET